MRVWLRRPPLAPRQLVQRRVQLARCEGLADRDLSRRPPTSGPLRPLADGLASRFARQLGLPESGSFVLLSRLRATVFFYVGYCFGRSFSSASSASAGIAGRAPPPAAPRKSLSVDLRLLERLALQAVRQGQLGGQQNVAVGEARCRPSNAAWARAALRITRSARCPSTPSSPIIVAMVARSELVYSRPPAAGSRARAISSRKGLLPAAPTRRRSRRGRARRPGCAP